jgi:hypothetical protein
MTALQNIHAPDFFGQREGVFANEPTGGLDIISIRDVYEYAMGLAATTHRYGGRLLVRCPDRNHEDVHPSCLLKPDLGVWRCQACGAKGGKLDLVVAAGHATSRAQAREWLARATGLPNVVRPQPALKDHRRQNEHSAREIRAVHSYCSEDGTVTEQCVRYRVDAVDGSREKTFDMRRPDGTGNWIYHHRARCDRPTCACAGTGRLATIVPPVLPYRLPGILAAGREGRTAILVEGEGDADRLTALNLTATTNSYGTDFQYPSSWKRFFDAVPRWVVLCDADDPGRKAAAARAAFIGPTAIVVDLFPRDVAKKGGRDVSDWLALHPGKPEEQRAAVLAVLRTACK